MKRGISSAEGVIVVLVTFGLVMVVLALLYPVLFDVGKQQFTKSECQFSLQLTRAVDKVTNLECIKWVDNPIPLKCTRRFLSVTEDDVLIDGESIREEYNSACSDGSASCLPENVFATEMGRCWNVFFEGENPVFQQVEKGIFEFFDDEKHSRACFVCGEVELNAGRDIVDFKEYLKSTESSPDISYYLYLARNRKAMCTEQIRDAGNGSCWDGMGVKHDAPWYKNIFGAKDWPGLDQSTYRDGETYAITFVRQGMSTCRGDDRDVIPTMTVQALPAENVGMYCDVVMV